MNEKGVTEIDLMLDDEGRDMDDEDYNEDWVEDNRVWALCSSKLRLSKYGDEEGYASSIKLNKKGDDILITAEGEDNDKNATTIRAILTLTDKVSMNDVRDLLSDYGITMKIE